MDHPDAYNNLRVSILPNYYITLQRFFIIQSSQFQNPSYVSIWKVKINMNLKSICFEVNFILKFIRHKLSNLKNPTPPPNLIHPIKMPIPSLPLDLWYEVFGLLNIDEAIAVSKASPRLFGAFILSKQCIRFRNAINSYMRSNAVDFQVGPLSSFVCSLSRNSSLEFSSLISWLEIRFRPVLSSSIVLNHQSFKDLSSTIAFKDRGFVGVSSSVIDWTVKMKADDGSFASVSWILLYRASLSGYRAADFHQACDGMGKCVVVVKAENERVAAAYNEDGFTSINGSSPNPNGFIVSVSEDGGCGEIFHRANQRVGIWNHPSYGPDFGDEYSNALCISNNCHQNDDSYSRLGRSYGSGSGLNQSELFGQEDFRVVDYEVFKIVIE
jgi:hypothetical protein